MIYFHTAIVFILTSIVGYILGRIYIEFFYLLKKNPKNNEYNISLKKELKKDLYFFVLATSIPGAVSYLIYA